jgi:acyl-coenzyme A synthetase/AMP-(fatty) acid ligase
VKTVEPFPPWVWRIPARFNIAVACTDAHLGTAVAERPAVVVDHDAGGIRSLTYRELAERTSRFAGLLQALDVAVGDRVLIRLPNSLQYSIAFLGTMKRGAIAVPTSTLLTGDEVEFVARDADAVTLVTDGDTWRTMRAMLERQPALRDVLLVGAPADPPGARLAVHDLDARLASASAAEPHQTRAEDPAYLVYTSGTTGYAKGVLHAHRALLGRQPSSEYWFAFDPAGDRVLHAGKYNWTYVLGTGLMDPLYRGHTAIVCEGTTQAASWPRRIARHGATIFIAVPTIYRQILEKTTAGAGDVPTLRHCMSAGEQLPPEVLAAWRARFGLDIYEGLGMTECSYYLCQTRSRPVRPGSAGFAQPGHEVTLRDPETWKEVDVGAEGMLCIPRDDPGLMLRYWNQPEETARAFHGPWFLTGDYARRDPDGYLCFLGRKDDLINSFGYRVSPFEVERVLASHPDVGEVAAVGEEVGPGKIVVAAYVIGRPGATVRPETILAYAREHLAAYKAPRIVHVVDDFPRTRNGKVLRRALAPALARNAET